MAGYSGTPLTTKLGIKEGHRVAVLGAPEGFALDLPDGVTVTRRLGKAHDLIVFFTTERSRFAARLEMMTAAIHPNGSLWVAWPKKASKVATDMTDHAIREIALPTGVVDNKVCAIDDTWTGLRLVWRVERR